MPTIPALQPSKTGPRSDFAYNELRKNVFKYGMDIKWEMANLCPCGRQISTSDGSFTIDTREKTVSCAGCSGTGVIYHSSQTIKALVSDASRDPKRWALWGEHAAGALQLTLLPEHLPGFLDRFTTTSNVMVYRERKKRKATVESLRYPVVTRTLTLGTEADPTVSETKQVAVLSCRRADSDGLIVSGELTRGVDFVINNDGQIDWSLGDAAGAAAEAVAHAANPNHQPHPIKVVPAVGDYYTIQYYMNPRYVVRTFPYQFRDTVIKEKKPSPSFTNLPTKVMAWLDFLTGASNA
jgi:hypothetical protein